MDYERRGNTKVVTEQQAQVTCPNCGRVKGHYQQVGNQVWLARDDEVIRVLRSVCACGAEFSFMASEKRLEDLIERIKK